MTHLSSLERHRLALARANEIGLDGIRRLKDIALVCRDMLAVLEEAEPDMRISVMAVDDERGVLRVVAAPRLPEAYLAAVDGVPYGPGIGSCGAAVAEKRRVIVRDIYEHENWKPYRALADLCGMRACWSIPVLGSRGEVIGTFAVYHPQPCEPSSSQIALINEAAQIVGIVLAYTLTHRKLHTTLKRLEFATEAGGIGIWDWDEANDQLVWDDRMLSLYGVDRQSFGGRFADFLERVDPEDAKRIAKEGEHALRAGQRYQCEFTITRASDGARRRIAEFCAPHTDPQTGETHLIGVDWDVTDQRDREEQLRQAQKMEAVGQLTGGVAHDLNNLLTVVLGNLELIDERLHDDAKSEAYLGAALKAATRGARLIDQLLAFSRRAVLTPEVLDIRRVILGIEDMIRRSLPETICIRIDIASDLWPVRVDRNQLENAVLNLALNARDAMAAGGELTISAANVTFTKTERIGHDDTIEPGRYVVVTATDTGTGMSEDTLSHAFEPFFTTKAVGKGSGLGLSMVYGFMKQSGGHARIESVEGEGTSVTLFFPAEITAAIRQDTGAGNQIPSARPDEKVLVVEDDPAVRNVIAAQLRQLGYPLGTAANGGEAITMLEADPDYRLLLTDLVMPGGWTGTALAERARALRPDLRVIYISGYDSLDAIEGPAGRDDDPLLTKPITRCRLAQALRAVFDSRDRASAPPATGAQ